MRARAVLLALALVVAALAVAPSALAGGAVGVTLKEFKVIPKPTSITKGKVVFSVRNTGKVMHELVVLKTNVAPGKLAVKNAKAVEVGRVGKLANVGPGKSGKLTLTLKAGKYVLLCNVAGHYLAKQYVGFTVR